MSHYAPTPADYRSFWARVSLWIAISTTLAVFNGLRIHWLAGLPFAAFDALFLVLLASSVRGYLHRQREGWKP